VPGFGTDDVETSGFLTRGLVSRILYYIVVFELL
jgi:hypothetical protein